MRTCTQCEETKPLGSFPLVRPGVWRRTCHTCRNRRTRSKRRYLYQEFKSAWTACLDCGESFPPYVLEFDHRPGEEKKFELSDAKNRGLGALQAEARKCDVVCANCHRQRTHIRTCKGCDCH